MIHQLIASRARRLRVVLLGVCLAAAPAVAQNAIPAYPIGPGDILTFSFTVMPDANRVSEVDSLGNAYVPPVGEIAVAGQTLPQLRQNLPGLFAGTVLSERVGGENLLVSLTPSDVMIDIRSYRPVFVTGDVEVPGRQEFRTGLTVRQAIAEARGLSDVVPLGTVTRLNLRDQPAVLAADLRNRLIEVAFRQAELAKADQVDAARLRERGASDEEAARIAGLATERLRTANARFDARMVYLNEGAELARERVIALLRQEETMAQIATDAEREVARVQSLVNRRLAPSDQLASVRRLYLQSVERLRDIRSEKLAADVDRRRLELERDQEPLDRQAQAQLELQQSQSEAALLRAQLASIGDARIDGEFDAPASASQGVEYIVYRLSDGQMTNIKAAPDDFLMPGDVVAVSRL